MAAYFLALLIGLVLGLVGSGGSIVTMPVLVYTFDMNPVEATTYSLFIVGTAALGLMLMFSKSSLPELAAYSNVKWYQYSGGLLGAFVVTVTLVSVSRIGAANMFVLIIAGQLITAVIIDHFGMLGLQPSTITFQKTIGVMLLVFGVYLVNKK